MRQEQGVKGEQGLALKFRQRPVTFVSQGGDEEDAFDYQRDGADHQNEPLGGTSSHQVQNGVEAFSHGKIDDSWVSR